MWRKQFGGSLSDVLIEQYAKSPNWKDGKFHNLIKTSMDIPLREFPSLLYKTFFSGNGREPQTPLPVVPFDTRAFLDPTSISFAWFGHSALILYVEGKTILIDPMLGSDAAPIAPFSTRRFSEKTLALIDELPDIDLLLLSHDHYDHLDLASMLRLIPRVKQYYVALGTARHLMGWGVSGDKIIEFDWWDQHRFQDIGITYTPTRHFSGRGLLDRFKSLWGGWVLESSDHQLYFSGDGGYGPHFTEVGERLGPFDFGFMECGQYSEHWPQTHMFPEESVQAALDAGVTTAMPVHWGGFALAQHTWQDPVERFCAAATEAGLKFLTPELGEIFSIHTHSIRWWESME